MPEQLFGLARPNHGAQVRMQGAPQLLYKTYIHTILSWCSVLRSAQYTGRLGLPNLQPWK